MRSAAKYAFALLVLTGAYLGAFADASVFYEANVLLHLGLGLILGVAALAYVRRYPQASGAFIASAAVALYLVFRGNLVEHRWALWTHIALALLALLLIARKYRVAYGGIALVVAGLVVSSTVLRSRDAIEKPLNPP